MSEDAAGLLSVLALAENSDGQYIGQNLVSPNPVVYGGQMLAQVVIAASRSMPGHRVKSLHTIFARGAAPDHQLDIATAVQHQGRSFGSLDVTISQGERMCVRSLVLMHTPDDDLIVHDDPAPEVQPPESSPAPEELHFGWDLRILNDADITDPAATGPPELLAWSRFATTDPSPEVSQALLAYASDGLLIGTAMRPHPGVGQTLAHVTISTSVIAHTIVFHRDFDAGEWLLLCHRSPQASGGRSFGRADVYDTSGAIVASFSQENMIRDFAPGAAPAPGKQSKY